MLQHARFNTQCVIVSQSVQRGEAGTFVAPGFGASVEVGETGASEAGLGICKAARLHVLERVLRRGEEVSPVELAARRTPHRSESSGEGSEFVAGQV